MVRTMASVSPRILGMLAAALTFGIHSQAASNDLLLSSDLCTTNDQLKPEEQRRMRCGWLEVPSLGEAQRLAVAIIDPAQESTAEPLLYLHRCI